VDAKPLSAEVLFTGRRDGKVVCCWEAEPVEVGFGDDGRQCSWRWPRARLASSDSRSTRSCPTWPCWAGTPTPS